MTVVDDVTLQAIWWRVVVEPGTDNVWNLTVPTGDQTGTWQAFVYASERRLAQLVTLTANVVGQTISTGITAAQCNTLLLPGRSRFSGHWDLSRTDPGGSRETWVKGPFIINAGLEL